MGLLVARRGILAAGAASPEVTLGDYSDEVADDNPLMHLSATSNGTWTDISGNGRHATIVGATTGLNGPTSEDGSEAVGFDGTDDYASVTHGAWMDVAELTLEVWLYVIDANALLNQDTWFGRPVSTSPTEIPYVMRYEAGVLGGGYFTGGDRWWVDGSDPSSVEASWVHCVLTVEDVGGGNRELKWYENKVLKDTGTTSEAIPQRTSDLFLGAEDGRRFFECRLAEPALYDYPLSATRVGAHYDAAVS